jgi:hypothetical protein
MSHVAVYPETCLTSKPIEQIHFIGHSLPHFAQVREELARRLADYPQLPLWKADFAEFQRVHSIDYLAALQRMAGDERAGERPRLSVECTVPLLSEIYTDEMAGQLNLGGIWYRAAESLAVFQAALENLP